MDFLFWATTLLLVFPSQAMDQPTDRRQRLEALQRQSLLLQGQASTTPRTVQPAAAHPFAPQQQHHHQHQHRPQPVQATGGYSPVQPSIPVRPHTPRYLEGLPEVGRQMLQPTEPRETQRNRLVNTLQRVGPIGTLQRIHSHMSTHSQSSLQDRDDCPICLQNQFSQHAGHDLSPVETPCEHTFHRKCLVRLLVDSNLCPMCRADISVCRTALERDIAIATESTAPERREADARRAREDREEWAAALRTAMMPTIQAQIREIRETEGAGCAICLLCNCGCCAICTELVGWVGMTLSWYQLGQVSMGGQFTMGPHELTSLDLTNETKFRVFCGILFWVVFVWQCCGCCLSCAQCYLGLGE